MKITSLRHRLEQTIDKDHTTLRELLEGLLQTHIDLLKGSISMLPNKLFQRPAPPTAVFSIEKHGEVFCSRHKSTGQLELAHGSYLFIVPRDDPGSLLAAHDHNTVGFAESDTVDGHSSLSNELPVYFAGTLQFDRGRLCYWSNNSGHYRPAAHTRHLLLPYLGKLITDELFCDTNRFARP